MLSRRAIQPSGIAVLARSTLTELTVPGSLFRRVAKSHSVHLSGFRLRKWHPCDPLDSSHDKSLSDTALAVYAPCPYRNETLQQVNAINWPTPEPETT
jgi:hypothetical protein